MFCSNCGVKIDHDGAFCTKCGSQIDKTLTPDNNIDKEETHNLKQNEQPIHIYQESENKNWHSIEKDSLVPLIIILCIVAVSSIGTISYMLNKTYIRPTTNYSNIKGTPKLEENATMDKATDAKKSSSTATSDSSSSSNIQLESEEITSPTYLIYSDDVFKLSCPYPSHFIKIENVKEEDRCLLTSHDKSTKMSIGAANNNSALSAKDAMLKYIDSIGGTVEYKDNGDTWYAVSITIGDIKYYRKCFVNNDYIRWFDFSYPSKYNNIYPKYIEYIEKNFKVQ